MEPFCTGCCISSPSELVSLLSFSWELAKTVVLFPSCFVLVTKLLPEVANICFFPKCFSLPKTHWAECIPAAMPHWNYTQDSFSPPTLHTRAFWCQLSAPLHYHRLANGRVESRQGSAPCLVTTQKQVISALRS